MHGTRKVINNHVMMMMTMTTMDDDGDLEFEMHSAPRDSIAPISRLSRQNRMPLGTDPSPSTSVRLGIWLFRLVQIYSGGQISWANPEDQGERPEDRRNSCDYRLGVSGSVFLRSSTSPSFPRAVFGAMLIRHIDGFQEQCPLWRNKVRRHIEMPRWSG